MPTAKHASEAKPSDAQGMRGHSLSGSGMLASSLGGVGGTSNPQASGQGAKRASWECSGSLTTWHP